MRSLIVAVTLVSALAFASGAFAQTTEQPAQPSTPATTPESSLGEVAREHPGWFAEPNRISLVRAALYSRTAALLALAAPHRADGTSVIAIAKVPQPPRTRHDMPNAARRRAAQA